MFAITRGNTNIYDLEPLVRAFAAETEVHGDKAGFVTQTMNSVFAALHQNSGDLWLWTEDGKIVGYVLGRVVIDVDNHLTYWLNQAYVAPSHRGLKAVKQHWQAIREQAKNYFCKHIVVVSARNTKPYCRFLGKNWHEYTRLLKEDI
jgi:ribosomal protein S18 acetylase RimI-like enzyme